MSEFDKVSQVKGNATNAIKTSKDVMIQMQKGMAVISAVKGALKHVPAVPVSVKALLDTPYGDMFVGILLHTTAPMLTGNPTILTAIKAANVVGTVEVARQFTFIQDAIEGAIASVPGLTALVDIEEEETDEAIED